jgi:phage N-6-adenine-methyltransferase
MKGQKALFSKASDEWETPGWLFDKLNSEFHFELDAASTWQNKKCKFSFTKFETDALLMDWLYAADRFFLNPPYSKIAAFMKKAYEESMKGATVVCLIPCRCDTRYWHEYCMKASEIRFIKGRLKFTLNKAEQPYSATFPSAVVIFDERMQRDNWDNPKMCTMVKAWSPAYPDRKCNRYDRINCKYDLVRSPAGDNNLGILEPHTFRMVGGCDERKME